MKKKWDQLVIILEAIVYKAISDLFRWPTLCLLLATSTCWPRWRTPTRVISSSPPSHHLSGPATSSLTIPARMVSLCGHGRHNLQCSCSTYTFSWLASPSCFILNSPRLSILYIFLRIVTNMLKVGYFVSMMCWCRSTKTRGIRGSLTL